MKYHEIIGFEVQILNLYSPVITKAAGIKLGSIRRSTQRQKSPS